MKKGFSLLETVIAISVIMIISVGFYSLATFANNQFRRMQVKEQGIVMIENVKAIFDNETFVEESDFSVIHFSTNLQWIDECFESDNSTYTIKVNVDGTPNPDGVGTYLFTLQRVDNNVVLGAKILYKDKQIYEMPNYAKEVAL